MGKKVKKKPRSGQKEKRGPSTSQETVSGQGTTTAETPENVIVTIRDRGSCSHIEKGINLDKLSSKLGFSESFKCDDCRGNVVERRAKKGKGKQGVKAGINSKSETKAIWVCLECGHFSCGGVGLPTTPQSHAVRHAKQHHHWLAMHYENHQLLWCFSCDKLIPGPKSEDNKHKDVLDKVVKMLKGQPGEGSTVDVEDVWFGSGSVTSAMKSDYSSSTSADRSVSYSVRGLANLGNTCFFNSIMQNLLAINTLRDYLFKLDESVGPLSAALRKLFLETNTGAGLKSVINPRSLFGSLCTKAPQFRGYQQHDAHELLICLLDSLSSEELSARKHTKSSEAPITDPTFVDAFFGGQFSSTVTCLECRHSSTIYEPFVDVSLPVPTKKPPTRRSQPVTRGKKSKLPPKRSARNLSKISRDSNAQPKERFPDQSTGGDSLSGQLQSIAQPAEQLVVSSCELELSDSTDPFSIALDMGLTAEDLSAIQKPKNQQPVENVEEKAISSDSFAWLDYLDPDPVSHEIDVASETDEISTTKDFANEDVPQNNVSVPIALNSGAESHLVNAISETSLDDSKHFNSLNQGELAQQENAISQLEDEQNVKPQFHEQLPPEDSFAQKVVEFDAEKAHCSGSCSQVCSKESNTPGMDNDNPSQIQDFEVSSLTHKEDASTSIDVLREGIEVSSVVHGNEQDSLDFDGLGDLFNEPEALLELKPLPRPASETSDVTKNGVVEKSSESDPDEVDNADAPVSVESCLAFFMKPELLSKDEHAWQCENCSKVLREQRIKSRRKFQMPTPEIVPNGFADGDPSGLLNDGKTHNNVESMNDNLERDVIDLPHGRSLPQNSEIHENGKSKIDLQSEKTDPQAGNACDGPSEYSSFSDLSPRHVESDFDKEGSAEIDLPSAGCETEVSEQEDISSHNLKVKRDATKSILINKVPSILTIHLKRFTPDARGRYSKLNGHVNFRETIDVKPYMDPRCRQRESFKYRLVGVVEHLGTMRGGHYVAYVRATKDSGDIVWYHVSDAYVREASLDEVLRSEAYILFYEGI